MTKGDLIQGTVQGVAREVKYSSKGQAHTGVKVNGAWYRVWGDKTKLAQGSQIELEVSWVAPDGAVIFCTMHNGDKPPSQTQRAEPRTLEERVAELEELVRRHEVQLQAMASAEVPEDIPF